jgi:hypothetical protein
MIRVKGVELFIHRHLNWRWRKSELLQIFAMASRIAAPERNYPNLADATLETCQSHRAAKPAALGE